jgi:hypothetical protein
MLSSELRDKLVQFIQLGITTDQLEEWLVPRLPFLLRSPNTADADIVAAVELGLAEVTSGIRTLDEFRDYLKSALAEHPVTSVFYPASSITETGSANNTEGSVQIVHKEIYTIERM